MSGAPLRNSGTDDGPFSPRGVLADRDAIRRAFGVSKETVADWRRSGAPIIRVGRRCQARYDDLWDWLAQRAAGGAREKNKPSQAEGPEKNAPVFERISS